MAGKTKHTKMSTENNCIVFHLTNSSWSNCISANKTDLINFDPADYPDVGPQITIAKKVAIFLSVIAISANLLSLLAISKTKKTLNANLRLIISLCSADTLVALSLLLLSIDTELAPHGNISGHITCLFQVFRSLRMGSHMVTLLNLLGLALDHYYAIVKTLQYRVVTGSRKVTWTIFAMWVVSMILGFSDFYIPSKYHEHCLRDGDNSSQPLSTCEQASCTVYDTEHLVFATAFIIFGFMIWIYTSIFLRLQKKNSLLSRHRVIHKHKKQGIMTTCLILGTFVACWLPYCLFEISVMIIVSSSTKSNEEEVLNLIKIHSQANYCLYDLILLNSLCDPIIYACRMREVKRGYRNLATSFCSCYYKGNLSTSRNRSKGSNNTTQSTQNTKSPHISSKSGTDTT